MFDLSGKKALITGASGGIGSAIAQKLCEQGATVVLSGTRVEKLEQVAATISGDTATLACDLSDLEAVDRLIPSVIDMAGGLDILVNNAGITRDNIFMRMKNEEWDSVIAVNLSAVFRLSRAALKTMLRQRSGRIIGITSVVGVTGNPGQANYAAAKAGMIGMTKAAAQEVATRGVTVNTVAPGFIASAMTDNLNEKQRESILGTIPAGRLGTAGEVAAGVAFLASDEASYITGQTIHVNGGMAMI